MTATTTYEPATPLSGFIAVFVVLLAGAAGTILPALIRRCIGGLFNLNESRVFRFFTGVSSGTILSVAYIHSLTEAIETLSILETVGQTYAYPGLIILLSTLFTFAVEEFVHNW
jgi:hypothetical protein